MIDITEAWTVWADPDDAADQNDIPAMDAAALLIPQLIVELQKAQYDIAMLSGRLEDVTNPATEVYNTYDDPAYDWGTTSFVVLGTDDRIEDSIEDVETVKEFNDKFQVSNGKITYVVPKVAGNTYELRKALTL